MSAHHSGICGSFRHSEGMSQSLSNQYRASFYKEGILFWDRLCI